MSDSLEQYQTEWAHRDARRMAQPTGSPREIAAALLVIHSAYHTGRLSETWIGALVDKIIRCSGAGRDPLRISEGAYGALQEGRRPRTTLEHDPPISFYRDLIIEKRDLTADQLIEALGLLRVTQILSDEDLKLRDRGWKQNRPKDAYQQCGITVRNDN